MEVTSHQAASMILWTCAARPTISLGNTHICFSTCLAWWVPRLLHIRVFPTFCFSWMPSQSSGKVMFSCLLYRLPVIWMHCILLVWQWNALSNPCVFVCRCCPVGYQSCLMWMIWNMSMMLWDHMNQKQMPPCTSPGESLQVIAVVLWIHLSWIAFILTLSPLLGWSSQVLAVWLPNSTSSSITWPKWSLHPPRSVPFYHLLHASTLLRVMVSFGACLFANTSKPLLQAKAT